MGVSTIHKKIVVNKKIVIGAIAIFLLSIVAVFAFCFISRNLNNDTNTNTDNSVNESVPISPENTGSNNTDDNTTTSGRTLIVYFSAQGHTEDVANQMAENLNADIFEIEPVDAYTSADLNYTDDSSRVSREHADESLRDVELVSTTVPNWEEYDTVLIGYPIWWGVAAWPVDTFVKSNDFTGKTVIPFCTSASSSLGQSGDLLAKETGTGNWLEGHRFSSNPSDSDILEFTDSIS